VALASCFTLFWREGFRITSPNPFPFFPGLLPFFSLLVRVLVAREKEPDQGYLPLDDSLTNDG